MNSWTYPISLSILRIATIFQLKIICLMLQGFYALVLLCYFFLICDSKMHIPRFFKPTINYHSMVIVAITPRFIAWFYLVKIKTTLIIYFRIWNKLTDHCWPLMNLRVQGKLENSEGKDCDIATDTETIFFCLIRRINCHIWCCKNCICVRRRLNWCSTTCRSCNNLWLGWVEDYRWHDLRCLVERRDAQSFRWVSDGDAIKIKK